MSSRLAASVFEVLHPGPDGVHPAVPAGDHGDAVVPLVDPQEAGEHRSRLDVVAEPGVDDRVVVPPDRPGLVGEDRPARAMPAAVSRNGLTKTRPSPPPVAKATEIAATARPPTRTGTATQDRPGAASWWSPATPVRRTSCRRRPRVVIDPRRSPGTDVAGSARRGLVGEREQRLADPGPVGRDPAADQGGGRRGDQGRQLLEVDRVPVPQDRQVHRLPRHPAQPLEVGHRDVAQPGVRRHRPDGEHPEADLVVVAGPLDRLHLQEHGQDPVRGGLGQPAAPDDLGEGEHPPLLAEGVEHVERLPEHRGCDGLVGDGYRGSGHRRPSFAWVVAGRAIQGIGGGIMPVAFGIIRDELPAERVAMGISVMSSLLAFGIGGGIVVAGPLVDLLDYPACSGCRAP